MKQVINVWIDGQEHIGSMSSCVEAAKIGTSTCVTFAFVDFLSGLSKRTCVYI